MTNEVNEALEVFEQDINLGLSSTKVMGHVLAVAYRQLESALAACREECKDHIVQCNDMVRQRDDAGKAWRRGLNGGPI